MYLKIWILNHYATDMYFDGTGRHQGFAKYLIKDGHDVKIFCASTVHNSDINVDTEGKKYIELIGQDQVPYVMVKTSNYVGNGKQRIKNMVEFYLKIFGVMKEEVNKNGKPDVILASSVHPLTLVAGIQFAKKIKCPCICEVRDLWPLSIVEYSNISNNNPAIQLLYKLEHWIYKKCDALVFSFSNGKQYIIDKGWDKDIDIGKVHYINTGIDLELYMENVNNSSYTDKDLDDSSTFKIIYTGSIRKVNDLKTVVDAAQVLEQKYKNVRFIIYGDGDERAPLMEYCTNNNIKSVLFKGKVPKQAIPAILEKGNLLLINVKKNRLARYGVSWNKLFEYMASGKPIIANNYTDIINDNDIGYSNFFNDINEYVNTIEHFINMSEKETESIKNNCLNSIKTYDCKVLSNEVVRIANHLLNSEKEQK